MGSRSRERGEGGWEEVINQRFVGCVDDCNRAVFAGSGVRGAVVANIDGSLDGLVNLVRCGRSA